MDQTCFPGLYWNKIYSLLDLLGISFVFFLMYIKNYVKLFMTCALVQLTKPWELQDHKKLNVLH